MAFESDRSGNDEIWVCQSDGTACTQLTSFNGPHAGSPSWSPDGQWIAFDASGDKGSEVYVIGSGGGQPRPLGPGAVPRWSRDRLSIYYSDRSARGVQQLYRVPTTGGQPQPLDGTSGGWVPEESRRDAFIYYSDNADSAGTRVRRIPSSGGEAEDVLRDVAGRNFVVTDGGIWHFASNAPDDGSELHYYDFASRLSRRVYRTERPVWAGMSLSPDGRRLLFSELDWRGSDLMLVERFR